MVYEQNPIRDQNWDMRFGNKEFLLKQPIVLDLRVVETELYNKNRDRPIRDEKNLTRMLYR